MLKSSSVMVEVAMCCRLSMSLDRGKAETEAAQAERMPALRWTGDRSGGLIIRIIPRFKTVQPCFTWNKAVYAEEKRETHAGK